MIRMQMMQHSIMNLSQGHKRFRVIAVQNLILTPLLQHHAVAVPPEVRRPKRVGLGHTSPQCVVGIVKRLAHCRLIRPAGHVGTHKLIRRVPTEVSSYLRCAAAFALQPLNQVAALVVGIARVLPHQQPIS